MSCSRNSAWVNDFKRPGPKGIHIFAPITWLRMGQEIFRDFLKNKIQPLFLDIIFL